MMSHQAVSGSRVPQCRGGLQITRERSSAGTVAKSRTVCGAAPARQERETIGETFRDLTHAKARRAGGGQLDPKRAPVEMLA
jgi:hypothetical protein